MNLAAIKKSLSECHIKSTDDLKFFEDAGTQYLACRAREELVKLDKELSGGNKSRVDDRTRRIIQLLLMIRVKSNGTVQKASNGTRRTRSKNPGGTGNVPQVPGLVREVNTREPVPVRVS